MIKMISIDSSSSITGMAVFIDGMLKENYVIKKKNKDNHVEHMCRNILKTLDEETPDIIVIETPIVTRNAVTQRILTLIYGCVYTWCLIHDKEFHEMRPSEWRKWSEINFQSKKRDGLKKEAIDAVMVLYPDAELTSDDTAEAILIGLAYMNWFSSHIKKEEVKDVC